MQDYFKHYCVLEKSIKLYCEEKEKIESLGYDPYEMENNYENERLAMQSGHKIKNCFLDEYNLFYDKQYFFGCSFKVYKETYNGRLVEFNKTFFVKTVVLYIL
jgi:hypothetical protein